MEGFEINRKTTETTAIQVALDPNVSFFCWKRKYRNYGPPNFWDCLFFVL